MKRWKCFVIQKPIVCPTKINWAWPIHCIFLNESKIIFSTFAQQVVLSFEQHLEFNFLFKINIKIRGNHIYPFIYPFINIEVEEDQSTMLDSGERILKYILQGWGC